MNVREMIEELSKFDPEALVVVEDSEYGTQGAELPQASVRYRSRSGGLGYFNRLPDRVAVNVVVIV